MNDEYPDICFSRLVIHVALAILNDLKNEICHFNLSCPRRASCKIITCALDIKSLIFRNKHPSKQAVLECDGVKE